MTILVDCEGLSIRLTKERWDHISEHPEMKGMEEAVEETLRFPEIVVESSSDFSAKLYYHFYQSTIVGGKYLCVVVKCTESDAFVITAYLTDRAKRGKILWPKKS